MGATIRDVASRAGVSISTVSRVLNNTCPVRPDKRDRVLEAVRTLSYTPHPAARSLLKRQTGGLGVLLPYVTGEYFGDLLTGIDETARDNGYFLLISTSHDRPEEWRQTVTVMRHRVDGLIVMAPRIQPGALQLRTEVPTAFISSPPGPQHIVDSADLFDIENTEGGSRVTRHLLELGHRDILCARGPERAHDADERLAGYRLAMRSYGLGASEQKVIPCGYDQTDGYEAGKRLFSGTSIPTAIVAPNDYSALGFMRAAREEGVRVPEELSVTGFDDVPSASYSSPPLTTINSPVREIGLAAVRRIIDRIEGRENGPAMRLRLPVRLVVRASTAPPR